MRLIFLYDIRGNMFDKKKKMKQIGILLVVIAMLAIVVSQVKIRSVKQYEQQGLDAAINQSIDVGGQQKATDASTDNSKESQQGQLTQQSVDGTTDTDAATSIDSNGDDNGNNHEQSVDNVGENETIGGENDKETETESKANNEQYITCMIEIRCEQLLPYKEAGKTQAYNDWIPDDGIILTNQNVRVKKDACIYDVLIQVVRQNRISIDVEDSMFGKYIRGINNLTQNLPGIGSSPGWIYYVNSQFINESCSNYTVAQGDQILWTYSCTREG
jgi:hypothetical protein